MSFASALRHMRSVLAPQHDPRLRQAARSAAEALEGRVLLSGVYTITPPVSATGDVPDKVLVADLPAGRYG